MDFPHNSTLRRLFSELHARRMFLDCCLTIKQIYHALTGYLVLPNISLRKKRILFYFLAKSLRNQNCACLDTSAIQRFRCETCIVEIRLKNDSTNSKGDVSFFIGHHQRPAGLQEGVGVRHPLKNILCHSVNFASIR